LIFNRLRNASFRTGSCLQFSSDPAIARGWFERHELSAYGGANSLDIQNIERGDASYDIVVCNHVLEHVADYRPAIKELVRVTKPDGFLFLSFPNPYGRASTEDWGHPKPEQHGHYRVFGRDVEQIFSVIVPQVHVVAVEDTDPVTGVTDLAYILTRSDCWLARIFEQGCRARICQARRDEGAGPRRPAVPSREQSVAVGRPASTKRAWYLVSLCDVGRFASRYSVAAVCDSFDDVCWLDLDNAIDPDTDLGVTGLAVGEAGYLYLAVQSLQKPRLLQLDQDMRLVGSVPLPGTQAPVALAVENTTVYLASRGGSTLHAIDMAAPSAPREVAALKDEFGTPIHPSGIGVTPNGLVVSGFAACPGPSGSLPTGSVVEVTSGRTVIADLREPHSVVFHGGVLHVLSSASGEYFRQREDGPSRRHVIGGYLRGLCIDDDRILIGRSAPYRAEMPSRASETAERWPASGIVLVSPATGGLETIDFSLLGSDIFDIVKLPARVSPPRIFGDPVRRRVASLRDAQYRLGKELEAVRGTVAPAID
jgi:hypothetical protein